MPCMAWMKPHSHASTSSPSVNGQIVPTLPNIYASMICGDGFMFGVSHCCWRREKESMGRNKLPINSANIFYTKCKFKLANTQNCLFQGISSNLKPQRKSRLTRKFNDQAERQSKASNQSKRPRSCPWSVNEAKTRGRRSKAKERMKRPVKPIPLHKGKH